MENKLIKGSEAFAGQLPDLSEAQVAPLQINSEYWTPENVGESRRVFFKDLRVEQAVDQQSGEDIELTVLYLVEQIESGKKRVVRQASKRLVGVFESYAGTITEGMPFEITYLGKKKNKINAFMSDNWSVVPLIVNR